MRKIYIHRPYKCYENSGGFRVFATFSPLWMLGAAGILNNCNWVLFCLSVKYFDKKNTKFFRKVKVILGSIFFIILGIITIAYVATIAIGGTNPDPVNPTLLFFIDWFGIGVHFLLGVAFIITGLILK